MNYLTYKVASSGYINSLEAAPIEGKTEQLLIGTASSAQGDIIATEWLSIDGRTMMPLAAEMMVLYWLSLTHGIVADERVPIELRTIASAITSATSDLYGKHEVH